MDDIGRVTPVGLQPKPMTESTSSAFSIEFLSRIEEVGLNASAPPQQRFIDGWLVRFCPGKAKRARCVNAIAAGRAQLAEKLALCQQVYDAVDLPMLVRITPFSEPRTLSGQLDHLGFRRMDDTRVMVCTEPGKHAAPRLLQDMSSHSVGHEAFAQTVGALRGSSIAQRRTHAQRLANSPVPFFATVLKRDGEIVACGQHAIEGELVGLYDIFTAPAARGQGIAGMLCHLLIADAMSRGAKTAYLQVEGDNVPARAAYQRLGFVDGYGYHYRTMDPGAS
jgi:ribosomal protein S18 acetylase RimI-like enzyme